MLAFRGRPEWGRPTNVNNVETWATVPHIVLKGADWFRSIGTEGSKGTKIFSLVGKVNNTGFVEVPMGVSLREMVFDIRSSIQGSNVFEAVQTKARPEAVCRRRSSTHRWTSTRCWPRAP